jgi:hypothetical protein
MQRIEVAFPGKLPIEATRERDRGLPPTAIEFVNGVDDAAGMRHGRVELVEPFQMRLDANGFESG